jgi:hypothetical protein
VALAIFLTPQFFFHGHFEIKSLENEMKSCPVDAYRVYWGITTGSREAGIHFSCSPTVEKLQIYKLIKYNVNNFERCLKFNSFQSLY